MKILVCGGRTYGKMKGVLKGTPEYQERFDQYHNVHFVLDEFAKANSKEYKEDDDWLPTDIEIISGMAQGADTAAVDWAVINYTKVHEFPADWKTHGKKAGPIRNQQMIDEGNPDVVIAFPGGVGTTDMIRKAKKHGIKVIEIKTT